MPNNAKILSYSMVSQGLMDPKFYELLPEFSTLKNKLQTLNINITKPSGCRGCQKRKLETNLFKDFLSVTQSLDENGISRFKEYYKLDKLMMNVINPTTKNVEFKII